MSKTTNHLGIMSIFFVFALLAWPAAPMAQINHSSADFGDVVVGTTETIIVTITHTGEGKFYFDYALPSNPCGFSALGTRVILEPTQSTDITVEWTPSEPGQCSADLQILNIRTAVAAITLTGNGVIEVAKVEVLEAPSLVDAFDEWVAKGEIQGKGRGRAAIHYLNAYRNLLVRADYYLERGQARKAHMKLMLAQKLSRHLLKGYAVEDLQQEINDALANIKQKGIRPVEVAQEERPDAVMLLNAYDEWVRSGDIKGKGAGKSAAKQVDQLRKVIEKAIDLMELGRTKQAYFQLMEARRLTWLFVKGDAVDDLREMIGDMQESLKA